MFGLYESPENPCKESQQSKFIDLFVHLFNVFIIDCAPIVLVIMRQILVQPFQLEWFVRTAGEVDIGHACENWTWTNRRLSCMNNSQYRYEARKWKYIKLKIVKCTCKLVEMVADIEGLIIACGIFEINECHIVGGLIIDNIAHQ